MITLSPLIINNYLCYMSDEINNKIKKIAGLDIKKARAIILDAIGDDKKQRNVGSRQASESRDTSPLFFKDKKFIRQKKEIKLSESERAMGAKEIRRISGEGDGADAGGEPLLLKEQKYIRADKERKAKTAGRSGDVKRAKSALIGKRTAKSAGRARLKPARPRAKGVAPNKTKSAQNKSGLFCWPRALSIAGSVVYVFLSAILLFVILYSLFIVAVTRFDIDNKITRNLSRYLPVPAIITETGVIEYYYYKDELSRDRSKNDLIRELIGDNAENARELKAWKLTR